MDESNDPTLAGLARSFADIQDQGERVSIAVIHEKHIGMINVAELQRIFRRPVEIVHLAMLEEAYKMGVDLEWHSD
jgi:hypothetical protein